jgi:hypothetical protein
MSILRRFLSSLVLLGISLGVHAEDTALTKLHAVLAPLRLHVGPSVVPIRADSHWEYLGPTKDLRYATPALNDAKYLLRDWIESRLATATERVDERALAAKLNAELRRADLLCETPSSEDSPGRCDFDPWYWVPIGFVHPGIQLTRPQKRGVLVLTTGFGVLCGTDMSAYVYEWRADHWQRIWQNEQPVQSDLAYAPQGINSVHVSAADHKTGERLILTLGNMDWCSSAYYPVYHRLWRVLPGGADKLLLDEEVSAWVGEDPSQFGKVGLHEVVIEFFKDGFDSDTPFYLATRHYSVIGDRLTRIDPFAPNPHAFVEEWIDADWEVSRRWAASTATGDLREWHERLRPKEGGTYLSREFIADERGQVVYRCRLDPSRWEIGVHLGMGDSDSRDTYFVLRHVPPNHFEVVDIRSKPLASCDGPEPGDDEFSGITQLMWPPPR